LVKPLQSWKHNRTPVATEQLLELADREAALMPFPLQDAEGDQTADDVMHLCLLRARLTATQPKWIRTDADHFFDLGPETIPLADLGSRPPETMGGKVLGAVSDGQDLQATGQPACHRPIRVTPIGPAGVLVEAAILLEPTDEIPPIVPHPLPQSFREIPGSKEHIRGVTAPAVAGRAEPLQGQLILGWASCALDSHVQRHPQGPISPDEPDQREAIHWPALRARETPRQARRRGGIRPGNDCVTEDQGSAFPDEQHATGALEQCLPRPVGVKHPRQAVL
jgi:hypothetical protein